METSSMEYRLDLRGSNVEVTNAKILRREAGGEFEEVEDNFTEEIARILKLFAKVASEIAKTATPRFNKTQTLQRANAAAQRRSPTKRSAPKAGMSEISSIAKRTLRGTRRRRRRQ